MRVKYKGIRYILRPGFLISIDSRATFSAAREPQWVDGVVVDLLAMQFTASQDSKAPETQILTYKGVGDTWVPRI